MQNNKTRDYLIVTYYEHTTNSIGPSGVRALPLAAGINVGGHYKWHFFLSLSSSGSLLILPEGVVVGFQKKTKNRPPGGQGVGVRFFFLPEFLFILVRSPCKNLNSYDNPFWEN